jgi:AraC family transcriptional regulator
MLLNNTLEYIEKNLDKTLNIDDISKVACSSRYHFQRVFYALTGVTVTEYIKKRRLTLAAEELISTDKRIIDIALKYGYESQEAFTKAFKRLHEITPSALKKLNGKIKAFPKISFQISIKGESELVYRLVQKEEFKVFGVELVTTKADDVVYDEIPKFINKIFENGIYAKINKLVGNPKGTLLNGFHYGFEEDGTRRYIMGAELNEVEISEEFIILDIPKLTWAVFEGNATKPNNFIIQDIWRRIYSEWFPSSGFEQVEGPCIEKNFWNDDDQSGYRCEVWIPVKRKQE